jgi:two-component system NarL family response regulator
MLQQSIRVFLVDDHPVVLDGLAMLIAQHPDMIVVGQANTGGDAIAGYARERPDVMVTDMSLPDMDGATVITTIRAQHRGARILVLSIHVNPSDVRIAVDAGCRGYLPKTSGRKEIHTAIEVIHAGGIYFPPSVALRLAESRTEEELTPRETDVLRLVAEGKRDREIALLLGLSEPTIRTHMTHILAKLGTRSRTEAVVVAISRGLVRKG